MSTHELDVALTFGNIEVAAGLNGATPEARAVSKALRSTWAAFARSGDPANATTPAWPVYTADAREVLVIDAQPRVEHDVDGPALEVAAQVGDRLIDWFAVLA